MPKCCVRQIGCLRLNCRMSAAQKTADESGPQFSVRWTGAAEP